MAEFVTFLIDDGRHGVSKNVGGDFVYLLCAYTNVCEVGCRGCLRSGAEVQFCARGKGNYLNQYKYQYEESIRAIRSRLQSVEIYMLKRLVKSNNFVGKETVTKIQISTSWRQAFGVWRWSLNHKQRKRVKACV